MRNTSEATNSAVGRRQQAHTRNMLNDAYDSKTFWVEIVEYSE